MKQQITLLFLFPLMFTLTTSQMKTQLNSQCLCDVTSQCDPHCCCDKECDRSTVELMEQYNKCAFGFGIPFCNGLYNSADAKLMDLHSGLSTIYKILKRLFCVYRINLYDPTERFTSFPDNKIQKAIQGIKNIDKTNAVQSKFASLEKISVPGLFVAGANGQCILTNQITKGVSTKTLKTCLSPLSTSSPLPPPLAPLPSIRIFAQSEPSGVKQSLQGLQGECTTIPSSSPPQTQCTNILRSVFLFFDVESGQLLAQRSYQILGNFTLQQGEYVPLSYNYNFVNNATVQGVGNFGYEKGQPLILGWSTGQQVYQVNNPINLGFRAEEGRCGEGGMSTLVQIQFGMDAAYGCVGDNSKIGMNLRNAFNRIGRLASASTDFLEVQGPQVSTEDSNNYILRIKFTKIGAKQNPQYYILDATITAQSTSHTTRYLFIQFFEVQNSPVMYVPPPPKVNAYLADDFLYPFYVAQ